MMSLQPVDCKQGGYYISELHYDVTRYLSDSFEKIQLLALHAVVCQAAVLRMILVMNERISNLFLMITIHIILLCRWWR